MPTTGEYWYQKKKDVHKAIFDTVNRLERQTNRAERLKEQLNLSLNRTYTGLEPGDTTYECPAFQKENFLIINALQNIKETLRARLCTVRPKPQFMSVGGTWKVRRSTQRLDRFVLGEYHRLRTYEKAEMCMDDALWADVGCMKVIESNGKITHERVFPAEILVDEQGALTSDPRSIFQVKYIPAEVLKARFPGSRKAIEQSVSRTLKDIGRRGRLVTMDLVKTIEVFHIRSGPDADDGRHSIAVPEGTLYDEGWDEDRAPYSFVYWSKLPLGFYGQSLIEQQAPLQRENNTLFRRVQRQIGLNGMRIVAEEGSCKREHLTNEDGDIVWVNRGARFPQIQSGPSIAGDAYNHAQWLYRIQHELAGVSQFSASGMKPSGDMSGIALRTMQDVESQRHGLTLRAYERFILDIADLTVRCAKRIYKHDSDFKAHYVAKRFVETIKWSEVDIDHYVLQLWPANLLPSTPAGKLATAQDLLGAGLIEPHVAKMILDMPDIEGVDFGAAEFEYIDFTAERMLLHDEKWPPQEFQNNLPLAMRRIGQHIMVARMAGATSEDVKPLNSWLAIATVEIEKRRQRQQVLAAQVQAEMAQQQQAQTPMAAQAQAMGQVSPAPGNGSPAPVPM